VSFNIREAVLDLERHASQQGWDQPIRMYALVPTADLVQREPHLAEMLGISGDPAPDELTPVEQEPLPADVPLEETLGRIMWPEAVAGCAIRVSAGWASRREELEAFADAWLAMAAKHGRAA